KWPGASPLAAVSKREGAAARPLKLSTKLSEMSSKGPGKGNGRHYLKQPATQMKFLDSTPAEYRTSISALNAQEEKLRFFQDGKLPEFKLKGSGSHVESVLSEPRHQIRFELFHKARAILEAVTADFGGLDQFFEASYGPRISLERAVALVHDFLQDHALDGQLSVLWTPDLQCTGLMTSTGPIRCMNAPEMREFTLLLRSTCENNYLRDPGITCLMYHEVGTHFMRAKNEGHQPWYSDRRRFGLSQLGSQESIRGEEGLATLHTIFNAKVPMLANSALSYYSACMASFLDFRSLFRHLEKYVKSPENRWRICLRIKRALGNPNRPGGLGKDQRYFEGAVEILTHLDEIDFKELMAGKLCWSELARVRKFMKNTGLKYPDIMRDMEAYRQRLAFIRRINGFADVVVDLERPTSPVLTRQDLLEELLQTNLSSLLRTQPEVKQMGLGCCCCLGFRIRWRRRRQRRQNGDSRRHRQVTPVVPILDPQVCLTDA
ncbi:hypothetical protein BOX15_Mlig008560g1, partial [Macrostomum lignano]